VNYEFYRDEESGQEESESEEAGESQDRRGISNKPYSDNHLSPIAPRSPLGPSREFHTSHRDHLSPTSPSSRSGIPISVSRPQSISVVSSNVSQISIEVSPKTTTPPARQDESSKPPEYEPMYDYLRSHPQMINPFASPNSNGFLSPTSHAQSPVDITPYRDEPFIITLSPLSPHSRPQHQNHGEAGLPSYEELYLQHPTVPRQNELLELVRQMDSEGNRAEDVCKFVLGMILLALTVVGVGLAFNWGKGWGPHQCHGRRC
jgi:hypothetical protein